MGVCTAYYITKHPKFSPETHHITILEARRPAGGASGKAGGLLAMWAFPQQIVPLSFQLHQELAEEYNGAAEWGYRGLKTLCVEGNISASNLRNIARQQRRQKSLKLISPRIWTGSTPISLTAGLILAELIPPLKCSPTSSLYSYLKRFWKQVPWI